MKKYPAIALIELSDIALGIFTADAMVKKSPIALLKSGIISQGRYLIMVGGSTAAVDESFEEGVFWGQDTMIDRVILPDIHPQLHDAVLGNRNTGLKGAVAIIETPTISCNVRGAERALKTAPVDLLEIHVAESTLAGKGISIFQGALYDIEAAVEAAVSTITQSGVPVSYKVIPSPHEALIRQMEAGAYFKKNGTLDLEGE